MRSLLFVPGDSETKFEKAMAGDADALILDLEDSVAPANKVAARAITVACLAAARETGSGKRLIVRVNALDSGLIEGDLDAVIAARPDTIMLPKCRNGADVQHLSVKIAVREAQGDLPDGLVSILPICTETAASVFGLGTYAGSSQRLIGMTWGAEDLSADLGAEENRDAQGHFTAPFALARNLMICGAASAEVLAVDTVSVNFRDEAALEAECREARRDGFGAKMAIHPMQVPIINRVFTPDAQTIARARRIIEAFAANPSLGVVGIEGEMVDRPHLRRAERIMARAKSAGIV